MHTSDVLDQIRAAFPGQPLDRGGDAPYPPADLDDMAQVLAALPAYLAGLLDLDPGPDGLDGAVLFAMTLAPSDRSELAPLLAATTEAQRAALVAAVEACLAARVAVDPAAVHDPDHGYLQRLLDGWRSIPAWWPPERAAAVAARAHAQIRLAFPAIPIDLGGVHEIDFDGGELTRAVAGKTWREVDARVAARRMSALSFLDPPHIAQLLPVYLTLLVERGDACDVWTLWSTLAPKSERRLAALQALCTGPQRAAVCEALVAFSADASQHGYRDVDERDDARAAAEVLARWRADAPGAGASPRPPS